MSYNVDLPKEVAVAWRKFLGTSEGRFGVEWLRQNARMGDGETDIQLVRDAAIFKGYMNALADIEDRLTVIKQAPQSLEEAPLETPGGR